MAFLRVKKIKKAAADQVQVKVTLKGLRGGHSGANIHMGLGNANKLLARVLTGLSNSVDFQLINFSGGTLRNAIPREAFATLSFSAAEQAAFEQAISQYQQLLKSEAGPKDENVVLLTESDDNGSQALTRASRDTFLRLLNASPDGVVRFSDVVPGVVETSLNVGIVTLSDDKAEIFSLIRSLIDSGKEYVVEMLTSLGELAAVSAKV